MPAFPGALVRFLRDRKEGNFSMMFAVMTVPLLAAVAFTVDYNNMLRLRGELQNASDAATLYAARFYELNKALPPLSEINDFLAANGDFEGLVVTGYGFEDNEVKLDTRITYLPLIMSAVVNQNYDMDVRSAAFISPDTRIEVALVLDNTGSMASQGKIGGLKVAATNFTNTLFDAVKPTVSVKVGVVPFAQYVNVGTGNRNAAWMDVPADTASLTWRGCAGSRGSASDKLALTDDTPSERFPGIMNATCPRPLLPLSESRADVLAKIDDMNASGMTYIADGVMWGLRVLSPAAPFTEGVDPATTEAVVRKIMVVMTDGENTRAPNFPVSADHNGTKMSRADSWTQQACNYSRQQGVEVFTVTYGTQVPISAKNLMKRCASSPANFYDAASTDKLDEVFQEIALNLTRLRLSQ